MTRFETKVFGLAKAPIAPKIMSSPDTTQGASVIASHLAMHDRERRTTLHGILRHSPARRNTYFNVPLCKDRTRPLARWSTDMPVLLILTHPILYSPAAKESWTVETPACEWKYVKCNSKREVAHLYWGSSIFESECPTIEGQLLWKFIPHTLLYLGTFWQSITGTVELSLLPPHMDSSPLPGSLSSSELSSLPGSLLLVLSSPGSYAPWWRPLRTTGRATAGGHVVCVYRGCELAPLSPYML